ncbi:plastocyanin/azurin family copper-binding protein [Virgibacillus flavescens]|uniref:plastocyanin/azurin family copper-binding protein n=1 Tax=Virgibacillus flavescens TaxID=1611422 RepID=UPI003D33146D
MSIAVLTACGSSDTSNSSIEKESQSEENTEKQEEENNKSKVEQEEPQDEMEATEMKGEQVNKEVASKLLKEGESVTYSFPNEGEYPIHCDPHPTMKMMIIVKQDAETSKQVELDIADYEYSKKEVIIAPGTSIIWTNKDLAEHNVHIEIK